MKAGAANYIIKENIKRLGTAIAQALDEKKTHIERKQAADALQNSEILYRTLFENASDGILYLSLDLKIAKVNEKFAKLHGYSIAEMLNMNLSDLDTPETSRLAAERVTRLLAGENLEFEVEHYHKDGHVFPMDVSASLVVVAGEVIIQTFHRDITERKQAQLRAIESETKLQSILSNSRDAIGVSRVGMHVFANPAYGFMFGYEKADDLVGTPVIQLIAPESREMVLKNIQDRARGLPVPSDYEAIGLRRDGTTFILDVRVSTYLLQGEQYTLVIMRDITERKLAEEKLTQSHELLENLARLVPGVIYQYRLYPDGRSAFPYSSPGMNDIYEVTPAEVQEDASPVFGRLHPEDYDLVADAIQESARTLQTFYCEFRVILPRQGLRWRWSQAQPERMADGGTLWYGIISDITERKQSEAALLESQRMLRYVLDTTPQTMFWKDKNSVYLGCNQVYARAVGLNSPADIVGKTDFDLPFPRQEAEAYRADDQLVITNKTPKLHILEQVNWADGTHIWADTSKLPLVNEQGQVYGVLGVLEDITEQKLAAQALNESEIRYRRLVENLPDIVYTFSKQHGGFFYSPSVQQVLGYSAEYLSAHPLLWNESIHPDDRPRIAKILGEFEVGKFFDIGRYRERASSSPAR